MDLKVRIQRGENGGFIASVPALRGCRSQGKTREEVRKNIEEAVKAWLEVEQDKSDSAEAAGEIELVTV